MDFKLLKDFLTSLKSKNIISNFQQNQNHLLIQKEGFSDLELLFNDSCLVHSNGKFLLVSEDPVWDLKREDIPEGSFPFRIVSKWNLLRNGELGKTFNSKEEALNYLTNNKISLNSNTKKPAEAFSVLSKIISRHFLPIHTKTFLDKEYSASLIPVLSTKNTVVFEDSKNNKWIISSCEPIVTLKLFNLLYDYNAEESLLMLPSLIRENSVTEVIEASTHLPSLISSCKATSFTTGKRFITSNETSYMLGHAGYDAPGEDGTRDVFGYVEAALKENPHLTPEEYIQTYWPMRDINHPSVKRMIQQLQPAFDWIRKNLDKKSLAPAEDDWEFGYAEVPDSKNSRTNLSAAGKIEKTITQLTSKWNMENVFGNYPILSQKLFEGIPEALRREPSLTPQKYWAKFYPGRNIHSNLLNDLRHTFKIINSNSKGLEKQNSSVFDRVLIKNSVFLVSDENKDDSYYGPYASYDEAKQAIVDMGIFGSVLEVEMNEAQNLLNSKVDISSLSSIKKAFNEGMESEAKEALYNIGYSNQEISLLTSSWKEERFSSQEVVNIRLGTVNSYGIADSFKLDNPLLLSMGTIPILVVSRNIVK